MREPLRLRFTDLISEARARALRDIVGRDTELKRLARTVSRLQTNNSMIIGPPGVGKTTFVEAFAVRCARHAVPHVPLLPIIRLDTPELAQFVRRQPSLSTIERLRAAFASLPGVIVWIDDVGRILTECAKEPWVPETIFQPFLDSPARRLILTLSDEDARQFLEPCQRFRHQFDVLRLSEPSHDDCVDILTQLVPLYQQAYELAVDNGVPRALMETAAHHPMDRALPDRAIRLLDEACAECHVEGKPVVTVADVQAIAAERTGAPTPGVAGGTSREALANIFSTLRARVRGQDHALRIVADIVRRGWLGLRNPDRPLGSCLFLGPSGVGKTECAKALAAMVYGGEHALVRLDLSEFADAHTRARLIGSPPGYVGHEEGGQLTNPIAARPFSLVLLDELEKAHTSLFDLFLQVLDDGRLTDGRGQTVDFTKTILIATSNLATREILGAATAGHDVTAPAFRAALLPHLLRRFRPEFLNRFDAIIVFRPLSDDALIDIGRLELRKIEERLRHHHIRFRISDARLRALARDLGGPEFGARPLKRTLEQQCEGALAQALLTTP